MAQRPDGSYEFGNFDGFNPQFHELQRQQRVAAEAAQQAAAAQRRRQEEDAASRGQAVSNAAPRPAAGVREQAAQPMSRTRGIITLATIFGAFWALTQFMHWVHHH